MIRPEVKAKTTDTVIAIPTGRPEEAIVLVMTKRVETQVGEEFDRKLTLEEFELIGEALQLRTYEVLSS